MPSLLSFSERIRGYSLLQVAVALAIMSLLMVILVPRVDDLIDKAYRAHVRAVGSAVQTGVYFYRDRWMTDRNSPLLLGMSMTSNGWPIGRREDLDSTSGAASTARCRGLWISLLDIEVPTLTDTENAIADFLVKEVEGHCRYYHQSSGGKYFIDYDTTTGRVSWNIR